MIAMVNTEPGNVAELRERLDQILRDREEELPQHEDVEGRAEEVVCPERVEGADQIELVPDDERRHHRRARE